MPAVRKSKGARVPREQPSPHLGEIYTSKALDLPGEEWREVETARTYEVSNLGRMRRRTDGLLRLLSPSLRNTKAGASGRYFRLDLHDDEGHIRTVSVHRLVALAFHGKAPVPDLQVAHINGNSLDNRAENLTWATAKENTDHQYLHGTRLFGDDHPNTKICRYAMLLVHHLAHQENWSVAQISRVSDLSETSVARIVKGKLRQIPPEVKR
jgi:hypothetical protein